MYHERLVECEHDDKLDRQELGERATSNKFLFRQTVKED